MPRPFFHFSTHIHCVSSALVPWGCCNQRPPTGWLKAIEMYCLSVQGARSLQSRCQQSHMLSWMALGKNSSLLLLAFDVEVSFGWSLACRCFTSPLCPWSSCPHVSSYHLPSVHVSLCPNAPFVQGQPSCWIKVMVPTKRGCRENGGDLIPKLLEQCCCSKPKKLL